LDLVARLRDGGLGVCFVSHRLDEVLAISDEITIVRDGRVVADLPGAVKEQELISLMLGADAAAAAADEHRPAAMTTRATTVELDGLELRPGARPVELRVAAGEIVGLTGLMGAGAEAVARTLAGAQPADCRVRIHGRDVRLRTPGDALAVGIAFIPEDRKQQGIFGGLDVKDNVSISSLRAVSRWGVLRRRRLQQRAEGYVEQLGISTPSIAAPAAVLSGGNQQKVLAARCLATGARVLVLHEPTHGVDVGAIRQIHGLLRRFAADGGAVVVASGEVRELLALCDRIAVFRDGELVVMLSAAQSSESDVLRAGVYDADQLLDAVTAGSGQNDAEGKDAHA
jgi:ABC-type sugar transport system ATPase subunit